MGHRELKKKQTILIADDDYDTVFILFHVLEGGGYKVVTARNGLEAIEAAEKELPSLILLDMMMPRKTGIEVCRALQENPLTEMIPIVAMTARREYIQEIQGERLGIVDSILKPFMPMEVINKIKKVLSPSE